MTWEIHVVLSSPNLTFFSHGQPSFRYYDSKLWNLRPYSVKNTKDFNIFKTNITKWCYSKQCASIDMFWRSHAQRLPLYLSFILNSCGWCGNDELFILLENYEFIRLFFLSPCIQYLTAIYVHVYFFSLTGVRVSIWYLFWSYIIRLLFHTLALHINLYRSRFSSRPIWRFYYCLSYIFVNPCFTWSALDRACVYNNGWQELYLCFQWIYLTVCVLRCAWFIYHLLTFCIYFHASYIIAVFYLYSLLCRKQRHIWHR